MTTFTWLSGVDATRILSTLPVEELRSMAISNYGDFYTSSTHWMLYASHGQLLSWWFQHYSWCEKTYCWIMIPDFVDVEY